MTCSTILQHQFPFLSRLVTLSVKHSECRLTDSLHNVLCEKEAEAVLATHKYSSLSIFTEASLTPDDPETEEYCVVKVCEAKTAMLDVKSLVEVEVFENWQPVFSQIGGSFRHLQNVIVHVLNRSSSHLGKGNHTFLNSCNLWKFHSREWTADGTSARHLGLFMNDQYV